MIDFASEITEDGIAIVRVGGWLEKFSCPYFSSCMEDLMRDGFEEIVIDCSDLGYISSSCLGSLIRSNKRVKSREGTIALANVNAAPAEVIAFLGLKKLFGIHSTVDAALIHARRRMKRNARRGSLRETVSV